MEKLNLDFFKKNISALIPRMFNDEKLGLVAFIESEGKYKEVITRRDTSKVEIKVHKEILSVKDVELIEFNELHFFNKIFNEEKYLIPESTLDFILDNYKVHDILEKSSFSIPPRIISKHWGNFNRYKLASNKFIIWDYENINRLVKEDQKHYWKLSSNIHFPFSFDLLDRNPLLFDWEEISINPSLTKLEKKQIHKLRHVYWIPANYKDELLPHLRLTALNKNEVTPLRCVSCNKNYFWETNEEDLIREKCDIWLISRFGKLDSKLIKSFDQELSVEKIVGTKYTKFSDFTDSHPIYKSGWENYFENENTVIDDFFVKNFFSKEIDLTVQGGNAMMGHYGITEKKRVGNFFNVHRRFNISLEVFSNYYSFFPKKIINEGFIDPILYNNIISPSLVNDKKLLKRLVKFFFNVDDRYYLL